MYDKKILQNNLKIFKKEGVDFEYKIYPKVKHDFTNEMKNDVVKFFDKIHTQKIQVAITFDDLPFAGDLADKNTTKLSEIQKILLIAKKYNIPEMYGFVNGNKVKIKEDEEILKLWTKSI